MSESDDSDGGRPTKTAHDFEMPLPGPAANLPVPSGQSSPADPTFDARSELDRRIATAPIADLPALLQARGAIIEQDEYRNEGAHVRRGQMGVFYSKVGFSIAAAIGGSTLIVAEFTEVPHSMRADTYADDDMVIALAKVRIDLERRIRTVADRAGLLRETRRFELSHTVDALEKKKALPPVAISAIRDILPICNRAIHGEDIDRTSAQNVIDVATEIMVVLEGVEFHGYSPT